LLKGLEMNARFRGLALATIAVLAVAGAATASNVQFAPWKKDNNRNRWYCEYRYPSKVNPTIVKVQICVWYPDDAQRKNYYYFVNNENKIWGRCVCPASPSYNPNVMQWGRLNGDQWTDLPAGECPAPKDGDPVQASIDKIPDPPV
jgi:hypothetical protein